MYAMDAVKKAAENSGVSLYAVSVGMGRARQFVNSTITNGATPRADTLARMLEQASYTLCAVPSDDVPPNALVID